MAGPYQQGKLLDSIELLKENDQPAISAGTNTTIGVIAVNAELSKAEATKVAQMAQNGFARTIFPAHTMLDGDTIFAVATGGKRVPVDVIGGLAASVMEQAVINAVKTAESIGGITAHRDLPTKQ